MRPPRAKFTGGRLAVATALAFAPKCLLCGLAYAGLLGLGGAELCGAAPATPWPSFLPEALGLLAAAGCLAHHLVKRPAPVQP